MVATDKIFADRFPKLRSVPGPLIFEPYATDLAGRIAGMKPRHVLETAAGTGVLTRAIASRLARMRASSQPISISPCSIVRRRSSLPIAA